MKTELNIQLAQLMIDTDLYLISEYDGLPLIADFDSEFEQISPLDNIE